MSASKVQRTETVQEATMSPASIHPLPTEHPHKEPLPPTQNTYSEEVRDRRSIKTIDLERDVQDKLEKKNGRPIFVPLAAGAFIDLWWSIIGIEMAQWKKADEANAYFYIHTRYFIDNREFHMKEVTFQVSFDDLLHLLYMFDTTIHFIRSRTLKLGAVTDVSSPFSEWLELTTNEVLKRHPEHVRSTTPLDTYKKSSRFMLELYDVVMNDDIAKQWGASIFFMKKVSRTKVVSSEPLNSCSTVYIGEVTEGKSVGFKYEYKCRIFPLFFNGEFDTAPSKGEREEDEEAPATQPLSP